MSFLISVSVLCSLKSLVGNISPQKQVKIQKLLQQFESWQWWRARWVAQPLQGDLVLLLGEEPQKISTHPSKPFLHPL